MRYRLLALVVCACSSTSDPAGALDAPTSDSGAPIASGCITDVASGDHMFMCGGVRVDAIIPAANQAPAAA